MKNKELMKRVAEELISDSGRNTVLRNINITIDARAEKHSHKRYKMYKLIGISITLAIVILLTFTITYMLKPDEVLPNLNGDNNVPPPIVYAYNNLRMEIINSPEELLAIYSESIIIAGFTPQILSLYRTSNDAKIPVYLHIEYVRDDIDENDFRPWDVDVIYLTIILVNDYIYNFDLQYSDMNLNESFTITINDELKAIKYNVQGDQGDGDWDFIALAKTKITTNQYTYYIKAEYFAPYEEGNRIQFIVEELFS